MPPSCPLYFHLHFENHKTHKNHHMISLRLLFSNIYYNYTKQNKNYKSNAIAFSGA